MTVSDREPEILMSTLRWLRVSGLDDTEIIIVNDCSRIDYVSLETAYADMPIKWIKLEPYACQQLEGNFNNPAKAFNAGLVAATGERLLILSSDVIVPPPALERARKFHDGSFVYCPMVIDLGTSNEYCGPHRVFPMPWFLYLDRQAAIRAGGWDEMYLLGQCYEDNDFVGRLALEVGQILCDWHAVVWHQSHYQPAYESNEWAQIANARNRVYTMDKWTAIPFGPPDVPAFEMLQSRHEGTGLQLLTFKDIKAVRERVWAKTMSPFVQAPEAAGRILH